jgi:predicted TIM-barrel fold metal-dependent hydrolase
MKPMNQLCDRRTFLHQAATATACAAVADRSVGARPTPARRGKEPATRIPVIDTHQHLWDLDRFRLPWIKKDSPLNRSFLLHDYEKATEGLGITQTIYMEVDVDPAQQQAEADHVLGVCREGKTPMVAAVVSGRPASDGFGKYIRPLAASKYIKGLRQVLHGEGTPRGYCLGKEFVQGIRLLGELGLRFDLCLRPGELLDGARLLDACPGTSFILDHCGNADVQARDQTAWRRDLAEVARRKNVVCKVSGIVASARRGQWTADDLAPFVKHTLDVFGPDRVMFGGDWPVCTLAATFRQWFEALGAIVHERSDLERRKLFHDNAVRVYGLTGSR